MANGSTVRIALGSTIPTTQMLGFESEEIKLVETISDGSGIVGTRGMPDSRARAVARAVAGPLSGWPTPTELDYLLPRIFGGTKSGNNIPLTEGLPWFSLQKDYGTKVYNYEYLKVGSATFSASQGGFLNLAVQVAGIDEVVANSGTFPSLTLLEETPYIFSDLVMTVGGNAYPIESFSFTIDHVLNIKQMNSLTPTHIEPTQRICTWNIVPTLESAVALYGIGPTTVSAVFTRGTVSFSLVSANVRFPKESPAVGSDRSPIMLPLTGQARITNSTPEVVVTNDSTA
jgi:hypothetical protein